MGEKLGALLRWIILLAFCVGSFYAFSHLDLYKIKRTIYIGESR